MSHRDEIELLASHYRQGAQIGSSDALLEGIYHSRNSRKQKVSGAMCGFVVAAVTAVMLLTWASISVRPDSDATASVIARYQMINSGLVENTASEQSEIAR